MALHLVFIVIACLLVSGALCKRRDDYTVDALGDAITSLPGLADDILAKYAMFSGYIDVDVSHNRSLFYWFVESLDNPTTNAVALWTNGGPGCSGLGGFFTEQGPFRPTDGGQSLYVNDYSWVNAANMLFIEAPAGVGFSFSDVLSDYTTNDNKTAIDNYHMIQGFLQKFPNYLSNEFYITSESYGGHYMPTLAQQIVLGNKAGGNPQINFKGFFVGNPYTDPVENEKGTYDTWFGHQLVSLPSYQTWYKECDDGNSANNPACRAAQLKLNAEVGTHIDPYALDFPVCNILDEMKNNEKLWFLKNVVHGALKRPLPGYYASVVAQVEENHDKYRRHLLEADMAEDDYSIGIGVGEFPLRTSYFPCESHWALEYLNRAEVQSAIHARPVLWTDCSYKVAYSFASMQTPMEPTWKWLIENAPELRLTIVSGDDDSVCGTLGTQSWIWAMGYTPDPKFNWVTWMDDNDQVGGYLLKFQNAFNFVTVHSAGHMIPETQPQRSLISFQKYLSGEF